MKLKRLLSLALMCIVGIVCASAYEVGQDVTSQLQTSWTNGGNNYDGGVERYLGSGFGTGKIIYMTTNAVESAGCYEVEFYAIANMAGWEGAKATGNGIAQAYIGDNAKYDLTVYSQKSCTVVKEANLVKGTINVAAGGTIELGIQNLKDGGTWYVCKLKSITYKGTPSASNPVDVTINYLKNPSFEIGSIDGWTNSGTVALGSLNTSPANNPKVGDYFVEKWGASGRVDFNQTTSTLPAGKYRIGVRARNEASAKAYLYAGSSQTEFTQNSTAKYTTEVELTESGTIKLGVKCDSHPGNTWFAVDHFTIEYMGVGEEELTPGQDVTGYITNPGFEDGNIGGWTVTSSADTGAKGTTNATYAALGTEGNYVFNHWSDGTEITQNIGKLPAGIYQLSAKLATGDSPELKGTVYLTLNGNKSVGMTSRNGNKQVMRKETITFVSDGNTEYTIGAVGAELAGGGHWWYKADDFKLTFINTKDNLYNEFKRVYDASAPWTASGDYYTFYNGYASYTNSTEQTLLLEAINYMNSSYDEYAWENASEEHPYDITDLVIKGADMTSNDAWPGSGRTQGEGQHWNGNPATKYFSFSSGEDRHQTVTIPYAGKYELRTAVRTLAQNAWAEIVLGDASAKTTDITGATGGNINIDGSEGTNNMAKSGEGYGWMFNKVSYIATGDNKAETITIKLSNKDKNTEANAGGMKLYYVGDTFDFVENGVHYWYGDTKEPTISLTNEVPVADLTNARLTGTANITSENTNGLVFKTSTQSVSGVTNNVVSDGTCANLVLTHNGGTFKAHKNFEATNASYTMDAIASNGKVGFGTLMLPFAVSTLPNSGKAYSLDQGVTFGEEINATEVSSINANTPVLVTAAGNYSASNVPVAATNDTYENGELVGTYKAMTAEAGTYVLQKHDNRVAFFLVGDTKPTVNPFRAYIKSQGTASAPMRISINFEDEATGISEVEADGNESAQNAEIYDLMGRKVVNPVKGIYIVNGKKVLINK